LHNCVYNWLGALLLRQHVPTPIIITLAAQIGIVPMFTCDPCRIDRFVVARCQFIALSATRRDWRPDRLDQPTDLSPMLEGRRGGKKDVLSALYLRRSSLTGIECSRHTPSFSIRITVRTTSSPGRYLLSMAIQRSSRLRTCSPLTAVMISPPEKI
jgi:hypothetical protein